MTILIGTRVTVSITNSPRFADCAKAGFDRQAGTVTKIGKKGDSPIYEMKPGGLCVPTGKMRLGKTYYMVRFDSPTTWPNCMCGTFDQFTFYDEELTERP